MKFFTLETLDQLNDGEEKPAKFAVIGNPVAHSLSPQLHQPALDALGKDCRYVRVEVPEGRVAEAFQKMREAGIEGINVTVPHKLEALEVCDEVSEGARAMGAVNTIVFEGERKLGFNTDGPGFARAVREEFGVDLGDLRVLIVGAGGGAGRAIATQCALDDCEQLVLANRTVEKLEAIRASVRPLFDQDRLEGPGEKVEIYGLDDPRLEEAAGRCELIINTSSLGLKRGDGSPISPKWLEPHHLVYDTIYNPPRTELLKQAEARGARVANGLSLLLHQGALSLEYWLGCEAPLAAMREGIRGRV
ncbi:MAG: shikimate dehydrogenase [Verrucomicrobiales bacterium]